MATSFNRFTDALQCASRFPTQGTEKNKSRLVATGGTVGVLGNEKSVERFGSPPDKAEEKAHPERPSSVSFSSSESIRPIHFV